MSGRLRDDFADMLLASFFGEKGGLSLIIIIHGLVGLNYCAEGTFLSPAVVFELRS